MPVRCKLQSDRERGPGHAVLTISGLPPIAGSPQLVIMRNQGTEPYLATDGSWQGGHSNLLLWSVLVALDCWGLVSF